jgi:glycosyltransferase involved in cell wall biosynthesis
VEIHQLLGAFHVGDAVGNEALAIRSHLLQLGYTSEIFAGWIDPASPAPVLPLAEYPRVAEPHTVCLLHFAVGSPANRLASVTPGRLVCIYHNITPARFFGRFSPELARLSHLGRRELSALAPRTEVGLGVSELNRRELAEAGFRKTAVLPYVFDFEVHRRPGSRVIRSLYGDGHSNILFVGRIVPNKRIEDLLRAHALYRRVNRRCRLLLVGDDRVPGGYHARLQEMVSRQGLEGVVFTGHVDQDDLNAYYSLADVFLCLSEHEGYGVPLVEAMSFGVPVIAYAAGAVAETLRGGGLLLEDKRPELVSELLHLVLSDESFREAVLASQRRAMTQLRRADFGALLADRLAPVLEGSAP